MAARDGSDWYLEREIDCDYLIGYDDHGTHLSSAATPSSRALSATGSLTKQADSTVNAVNRDSIAYQ